VADGVGVANITDKRSAIICDMDGTLVDVSSIRHYVTESLLPDGSYKRRNFDDFHKASLFCPAIWSTVDAVQHQWEWGRDVLIVTARSYDYERTTKDWLYKYAIPYTKLFMRPVGDFRSDVDVKRDILAEIKKTWNVIHAIDDNPQVCYLWREHGIPTTVVPGWTD
jgi:predicted secreted acid phosphatase